jgi:probable addiction module antidote protein
LNGLFELNGTQARLVFAHAGHTMAGREATNGSTLGAGAVPSCTAASAPNAKPFDEAKYLSTPEAQADLLADAFETGDTGYIANALGIVARARGMSQVAREAGVRREALYKALSPDGDPKLSTLLGVAKALGFRLNAVPA